MTERPPNLPGMGNPPTGAAQMGRLVERLLSWSEMAVDDLSVDQLMDTRDGLTNSIGFDVWHVVRTVDNIIHFVFEREQPVWLSGGFHESWGLPKVDQGTGMDSDDAYAMRFPGAAEMKRYFRAVSAAVVPKVEAMSEDDLAQTHYIRPWGVIPRIEAIAYGLIAHGNGHLGRASYARNLLGKPGLPY
jgi:DinB superfamily